MTPEERQKADELQRQTKLLDNAELIEEIRTDLIADLHIPEPSNDMVIPREDILFPSHLIGFLIVTMLQHDSTFSLQRLVNHTIQDHCRPLFWLSNVHELICIAESSFYREAKIPNNKSRTNTLRRLRIELNALQSDVLTAFLEDLKRDVALISVPAILDSQELPGLVEEEQTSFWSMFGAGGADEDQPKDDIKTLKVFLSDLDQIMGAYYLKGEHREHVMTEVIRVVGITSFNALLMRRNFSSFKRGFQIQYNVTQVEEWCKLHSLGDGE
ncbi:hypothetical protein DFJ73DRAFT_622650 [Zopfochytrium polystomum]|nr:hypothetical protein DFJ73DRAFT_622650 [Zopfochytrium polystomum]